MAIHRSCRGFARLLHEYCEKSKLYAPSLDVFCSARVCDMSISDYVERFLKYADTFDIDVFTCAAILIDRYIVNTKRVINHWNIHRILLTGMYIGAKLLDDTFERHFNTQAFASIGGVKANELVELELTFVSRIGYQLILLPETFELYQKSFRNLSQ